jgi:hypothetical protein
MLLSLLLDMKVSVVLPMLSVIDMDGCSFREIAKTTYALVVYAMDSSTVGISVAEDQTLNVAGNSNVASSVLQIKHCESTSFTTLFVVCRGLNAEHAVSGNGFGSLSLILINFLIWQTLPRRQSR